MRVLYFDPPCKLAFLCFSNAAPSRSRGPVPFHLVVGMEGKTHPVQMNVDVPGGVQHGRFAAQGDDFAADAHHLVGEVFEVLGVDARGGFVGHGGGKCVYLREKYRGARSGEVIFVEERWNGLTRTGLTRTRL